MEYHFIRSFDHFKLQSPVAKIKASRLKARILPAAEIILKPPVSEAVPAPKQAPDAYSREVGDIRLISVAESVQLVGHGLRVKSDYFEQDWERKFRLQPELTLTLVKSTEPSEKPFKHTIETRVFGRLVLRETHISTRPWSFLRRSYSKKSEYHTFVKHWSQDVVFELSASGISVSRPGSTAKWYYTGYDSTCFEQDKLRTLVCSKEHTYLSSAVLRQVLGDNFQHRTKPLKPITDCYLDIILDRTLNASLAAAITRFHLNLKILKNLAPLYETEEFEQMCKHTIQEETPYLLWIHQVFLAPMADRIATLEKSWAGCARYKSLQQLITTLSRGSEELAALAGAETLIDMLESLLEHIHVSWKPVLTSEIRDEIKASVTAHLNSIHTDNEGMMFEGFETAVSPKISPSVLMKLVLSRRQEKSEDPIGWLLSPFKYFVTEAIPALSSGSPHNDEDAKVCHTRQVGFGQKFELPTCFDVGNGLYLLLTYRGLLLTTAGPDGKETATGKILYTFPGEFDQYSGFRGAQEPWSIGGTTPLSNPSYFTVSVQRLAFNSLRIRCITGADIFRNGYHSSSFDLSTSVVISVETCLKHSNAIFMAISQVPCSPSSQTTLLARGGTTNITIENYRIDNKRTKLFKISDMNEFFKTSPSASKVMDPDSEIQLSFALNNILVIKILRRVYLVDQWQQPSNPLKDFGWLLFLQVKNMNSNPTLTMIADTPVLQQNTGSTQFIPASKGQYILILSFHKDLSYTLQAFDTTRASFTKVVEHRKVGRGLTEMGYQLSNSVASVDHKKKRWTLTLIAKGFDDLKYAVGRVTVPLLQLSLKL